MSGRGGGRRPDSRRNPETPAQSSQRGGGRGGRRGRRGGGDGGSSGEFRAAPVPATPTAPAGFRPATSPAQSVTPASSSSVPTASFSATSLSIDVEQRLTLKQPEEAQSLAVQQPPASSKAVRFPPRPGFGTVGRKCVVRANHFQVEISERDIHQYDVSIAPEVISKSLNRKVMGQLVDLYGQPHLGKRKPAYDGRKNLYTAGPLPFTSKEFVVQLVDNDDQPDPARRRERQFRVTIKLAVKVDSYHLQQFLQGRLTEAPYDTIRVLDTVLRESPSKEYTVVGRSFFSHKLGPTGELGNGAEYWKGYYQSLRPTQMGLSLNVDVSARSFYESITVSEFVFKYLNYRDRSRALSEKDRLKVGKALRRVKVELTHMSYVKRCNINGLSAQSVSRLMFSVDGTRQEKSVAQYFHEKYGVVLKYPSLPAIQTGTEAKPVYYPMEICKIARGQRYSRKLNERQVSAMLKATAQRPTDREKSIDAMVRFNNYNGDKLVNEEFGIKVRGDLVCVDARVLPPPKLKYHDTGRESQVDPRVGQWNMINKKMVNGGTVNYWTCVNFSTLNQGVVLRFCHELVDMCVSKGMVFNPKPVLDMQPAHPNQIEKALSDVHSQCAGQLRGNQLQLLIVILPDYSGSYGTIKRVCETELGIVSQCCQPNQVRKFSKQYYENVSLKINVKVGGRNTVLFDAVRGRIPYLTDLPTIVFGADVTHPQPGEDSSPSIAAVVASMDWPEVSKYRGLVSAQPHRVEIIQDLYRLDQDPKKGVVHGGLIRELLIAFWKSTRQKPYRIIFYRDGVSEGQFSEVLLYEMDAIRKACASLEEGYLPQVTFVVVQKRHHTRLFPTDRNLTDRSGNILPGTVVDTGICHVSEFDFYLNSHAGIQGTSRPTHYHVLYDENKFSADALQTLTNNLCYTYARCTRSVSIVPPAYYAHLAAFRARYYIEGDTSEGGSSSGERGTRERAGRVWSLPVIKDNVKDVMFYC